MLFSPIKGLEPQVPLITLMSVMVREVRGKFFSGNDAFQKIQEFNRHAFLMPEMP
jgi:hypothetical protein